jgi:chitinase
MTYWTKRGFPKEKLLLGIPLYGRGFPVKQWGVPYSKAAKNPFAEVSYNALKREHAPLAPTVNIGESFIVGLDTPESAAEKTRWARKQGVAGVFFWEISQDFDGETHTIVAATQATG